MFCKWCGKRITDNSVPCPHCGREQDPLESGNGFWDLYKGKTVSEKTEFKPQITERIVRENVPEKNIFQLKRETLQAISLLLSSLSFLFSLVLLIFSIVINQRTSRCIEKITEIQKNTSDLYRTYIDDSDKLRVYLEDEFSKNNKEDESDPTSKTDPVGNHFEHLDKAEDVIAGYSTLSSDSKKQIYYISVPEKYDSKIYWQRKGKNENNWRTFAEDVDYIIVQGTDIDYRIVLLKSNKTILNLNSYTVIEDDFPIDVVKDSLGENFVLFTVNDSNDLKYEWQFSENGKIWDVMDQKKTCFVDMNNDLFYRLVVYSDEYLYADFEDDTNKQEQADDIIENNEFEETSDEE